MSRLRFFFFMPQVTAWMWGWYTRRPSSHSPSTPPIRKQFVLSKPARSSCRRRSSDEGAGVELVELACWDRVAGVD